MRFPGRSTSLIDEFALPRIVPPSPVKSKDNVTERAWLVQKIMLPNGPPP